jgi:FKBP-type peptidyl-prolyl cis-trans isomerase FkpA
LRCLLVILNLILNSKSMKIRSNPTIFLLMTTILLISLVSCDPTKKMENQEKSIIQTFITNNPNLNFVEKPSGLYYLDVQAGTGQAPVTHDTAYIMYTGKLLNGTIFDSNVGTTDTLIRPVNEGWLISGVDESINYMKVGGKSMLLIPSKLAYGRYGYYSIPGYTPLIFDIELVKLKLGPGK